MDTAAKRDGIGQKLLISNKLLTPTPPQTNTLQ
jgi:hypothetical protein